MRRNTSSFWNIRSLVLVLSFLLTGFAFGCGSDTGQGGGNGGSDTGPEADTSPGADTGTDADDGDGNPDAIDGPDGGGDTSPDADDECPEPETIDSDVTEETTWSGDPDCLDYIVVTDISILAPLTVEEGTRVEAEENVGLRVEEDGTITAEGTEDAPVEFAGTDSPKGHWQGFRIDTESPDNFFNWVEIDGAGSSNWTGSDNSQAALFLDDFSSGSIAITNTTFRNNANYGIQARESGSLEGFANNTFEDNDVPMWLHANRVGQLDGSSTFEGNAEPYIKTTFGGDTLSEDATWKAFEIPYRLVDRLTVHGAWTIEPNVNFQSEQNIGIEVEEEGTITAEGTEQEPIVFEGTDSSKGFWKGIWVGTLSPDNKLDWVEIEGAGSSNWTGTDETQGALFLPKNTSGSLAITNTTLRNNANYGIQARQASSLEGFANNTFAENDVPMWLHPDRVGELDGSSTFENNSESYIKVNLASSEFGATSVTTDATWRRFDIPYRIVQATHVEAGLTIEADVTMEFAQDFGLHVESGGTLTANGESGSKVTFRGVEELQGYWRGIRISTKSPDNQLTHTDVVHAGSKNWTGSSDTAAALHIYGGTVGLDTVAVEESGNHGFLLELDGEILSCNDVTFNNIAGDNVHNDTGDPSAGCGL